MPNKTKIIIYLSIIVIVIIGGAYFLFRLFQDDKKEVEGIDFSRGQNQSISGEPEGEQSQEEISEYDGTKIMAQILKEGTGQTVKNGDKITAHYAGYLEDGTKFDSSVDRGQPFSFTLGAGQVISGWDLGIVGMKVGEIRRLVIPPQFGYGEQGVTGAIPSNATLIFEVELLAINQ